MKPPNSRKSSYSIEVPKLCDHLITLPTMLHLSTICNFVSRPKRWWDLRTFPWIPSCDVSQWGSWNYQSLSDCWTTSLQTIFWMTFPIEFLPCVLEGFPGWEGFWSPGGNFYDRPDTTERRSWSRLRENGYQTLQWFISCMLKWFGNFFPKEKQKCWYQRNQTSHSKTNSKKFKWNCSYLQIFQLSCFF